MIAFFEKYKNDAQKSALFPSVALAQSALESGYGNSLLASQYNNMFGIKATSDWDGAIVDMNTLEYFDNWTTVSAPFKAYKSAKESFEDHSNFLKKYSRYNKVLEAKTPDEQMKALGESGYATDPNYYDKLKAIHSKYDLVLYDNKPAMLKTIIDVTALVLIIAFAYYHFKDRI